MLVVNGKATLPRLFLTLLYDMGTIWPMISKLSKLNRGSVVVVKAYGGEKLTRRVVLDRGASVVICTEREYLRAEKEKCEPDGVAFPRRSVEPSFPH